MLDADRHRAAGRRSTASSSGRSTGVSFAYSFDDADAPERHTDAVLRDARLPGALPRRLEGGRPTTTIQADEPGLDDGGVGALRRARRPVRVPRPGRRRARAAGRRWSSGGGRRPSATRCCRSTTGRSPSSCSSRPTAGAPRAAVRVLARPGAGARERAPSTCATAPTTITAHVTVAPTASTPVEGVLAVQGSVLGGWSFHLLERRAGSATCTTCRAGGSYRVEADIGRSPRATTRSASASDPASRRPAAARRRRGGRQRRRSEQYVWSRFSLTGAGLTAG